MKMPISSVFLALTLILGAIHAAPKLQGNYGYGPYEELGRNKQTRGFDVLKVGGLYGVDKRFPLQQSKDDNRNEKHRRGPLNGLIPGGAFGRAARSEFTRPEIAAFISNKDNNINKLLRSKFNGNNYFKNDLTYPSFNVENKNTNSDTQLVKAFIDKSLLEENIPNIDYYYTSLSNQYKPPYYISDDIESNILN